MTTTAMPLVFIDTETTSLRRDRRPWEIAMILRDPDGTETEHVIQIRNVDRAGADVEALKIGGFYDRYIGDEAPYRFDSIGHCENTVRMWLPGDPPPTRVLSECDAAALVEKVTRNAVFIGVNPAFDADTLASMLERHGLIPAWHYSVVDLKAMAAGWLRHCPDRWPLTDALADLHVDLAKEQERLARLAIPAVTQRRQAEEQVSRLQSTIADWTRVQQEFLTPPYHSYALSTACGAEPPTDDEKHTALGDARWVCRWYDAVTGKAA